MEIFNIGFGEMIIIFIIALIVFGPDRLPEIGRQAGRMLREFRKMTSEVTEQVQRELELVEEPVREVRDVATDAGTQVRREVERLQEPVREAGETLASVTKLPDERQASKPAETDPAAPSSRPSSGAPDGSQSVTKMAESPVGPQETREKTEPARVDAAGASPASQTETTS